MTFVQEHREAIERLQAELQSLKAQHGECISIRKATNADEAPFPITVTVTVLQPPTAASYDVQSLQVCAVLDSTFVSLPEEHRRAEHSRNSGISIEVTDAALPHRLRQHIAQRLQHVQRDCRPGGTGSGLTAVFEAASRDFAALLTGIPELVEAYEGADAAGATVRRFAVIDEDKQVTIDAAVSAPTPQHPPHSTAADLKAGAHHGLASRDGQSALADATLGSSPSAEPELATAQAELTWLRRRYGSGMQVHSPAKWGSAAVPSTEAKHSDAGRQPQHLPRQTQRRAVQLSVSLTPTDPNWQSGPLRAHIRLDSTYPAAHSVAVLSVEGCPQADGSSGSGAGNGTTQLASSSSSQLSVSVLQMLAKLLTAQAASNASRPAPLKALLRSLENNAAVFVQQAEDMALEVQRRRQASTSAAARSADGQTPQDLAAKASGSDGLPKCGEVPEPAAGAMRSTAGDAEPDIAAEQPSPRVHLAALQPALSARHSIGQGLWWPGAAGASQHGQPSTDETAASVRPGSSVDNDSSRSTDTGASSGSTSGNDGSSDNSSGRSHDSDSGSEGSSRGQDTATAADRGPGGDGGARSAVAVELVDLAVDNIDVIEPHSLRLQVTCQRCRRPGEVVLPAGEGGGRSRRIDIASSCAHCHHDWEVGVRGAMVHEHSAVLARLWPSGCAPADLLPSLLAAQCGACSAVAALRGVQVGQPAQRDCSGCHRTMKVQIAAVAFTSQAGTPAGSRPVQQPQRQRAAGSSAAGQQAAARSGALEVGQPLPHLGTCSHYRHSHRWLRFPCCGQRFPCDLCHEEATDGHEMKWATRMVCGWCSLEQPLGERCSKCGKRLASNAHKSLSGRPTRHWEGGKGERDPKRLDRRDAHKYRGSKAKTASKKGTRVGQAAKKQRGQKRDTTGS